MFVVADALFRAVRFYIDTEQHCSDPAGEEMTPRPPHTPLKSTKHYYYSLQALTKRIKAQTWPHLSGQGDVGVSTPHSCPQPCSPGGWSLSDPRQALAWPEGFQCAVTGQNTQWYGEVLLYSLGVLIFECGFEGAHNSTFNNVQLLFNYYSITIKYTYSVSWSFTLFVLLQVWLCNFFFFFL